jgi:peptide/nickel transport system permease protein
VEDRLAEPEPPGEGPTVADARTPSGRGVSRGLRAFFSPFNAGARATSVGAAVADETAPGQLDIGEADPLGAERGYWSTAWYEFRHDRLAMIGLLFVILLILSAIFAPVIAPYGPNTQLPTGLTLAGNPRPPGGLFLLGTDPLGRDEFSRLLFGARISLVVGLGSAAIGAALGLLIGGVAGLFGGFTDKLLMRLADVLLSFPILLLATAILAVTQPGVASISIIVGIGFGAYLARVVYTQVVTLRERDFVLAARTAGVSRSRILVRHVLPHVMPSVIVFSTLGVATAIQLEAALSYVGLGIHPPTASWGNMIADGQNYMTNDVWLVLLPGIAIMFAMLGFSLVGDGLRDALDPTLERTVQVKLGGLG